MPPPRQESFVDRVYRVCKILRCYDTKAVRGIIRLFSLSERDEVSKKLLKRRGKSAVQNYVNSLKRTYSPINLFSYSLFKKCAFTLAEVLITLGIIGVVAAMTLPSLIANHRKLVLKTQLKKTYSEIQQINTYFIKDEGMSMYEYYDMLKSSITTTYPSPIQYFSMKVGNYFTVNEGYAPYDYNDVRGSVLNLNGSKNYGQLQWALQNSFNRDSIGRTYYFSTLGTGLISIDVNGDKNKPNKLGFDIFTFILTPDGKVKPLGDIKDASVINLDTKYFECSYKTSGVYNGMGCAYWASIDINPDNNKKTYWIDFIKY